MARTRQESEPYQFRHRTNQRLVGEQGRKVVSRFVSCTKELGIGVIEGVTLIVGKGIQDGGSG